MHIRCETMNDTIVAVVETDTLVMRSQEEALRLLQTIRTEHRATRVVLPEAGVSRDFLSMIVSYLRDATHIVGTMGLKVALWGTFDKVPEHQKKLLSYEERPNAVLFLADSEAQAMERLTTH